MSLIIKAILSQLGPKVIEFIIDKILEELDGKENKKEVQEESQANAKIGRWENPFKDHSL